MIVQLLGQLLLASSLVQIIPTDAADLAVRAGASEFAASFTSGASRSATLPMAAARGPRKVDLDSYGIVTNAASAIVVDAESGNVLFAKRPDEQRAFGSITKLMSVLVFLDTSPDLSHRVTVVADDYVAGGRVYLRFDDPVALRDVLRASLIGSDNTATQALARISGMGVEEFIVAMNAKAQELGMRDTHFVDLTGISGWNVSTARDLARLLAAAEANSVMRDMMQTAEVRVTQGSGYEVTVESTDELLQAGGDFTVIAGKTGYIPQAGYCLASTVEQGGNRVRIVVLGSPTKSGRFSDVKGLAAWAYATYSWD